MAGDGLATVERCEVSKRIADVTLNGLNGVVYVDETVYNGVTPAWGIVFDEDGETVTEYQGAGRFEGFELPEIAYKVLCDMMATRRQIECADIAAAVAA